MKFLLLNFLPASADLALLLLRLWFGLSMLVLHGWGKVMNFSALSTKFADPFGIGTTASVVLVIFAEVVCAALIAIGLFTRWAALVLGGAMFAAFWTAHGAKLSGPGNGEMAFLFLGASLALFICGAGRFSVDSGLGAKR